jgi:hypothetical protein
MLFTLQKNPWLDPVLERKLFLAQKVPVRISIKISINYIIVLRTGGFPSNLVII